MQLHNEIETIAADLATAEDEWLELSNG